MPHGHCLRYQVGHIVPIPTVIRRNSDIHFANVAVAVRPEDPFEVGVLSPEFSLELVISILGRREGEYDVPIVVQVKHPLRDRTKMLWHFPYVIMCPVHGSSDVPVPLPLALLAETLTPTECIHCPLQRLHQGGLIFLWFPEITHIDFPKCVAFIGMDPALWSIPEVHHSLVFEVVVAWETCHQVARPKEMDCSSAELIAFPFQVLPRPLYEVLDGAFKCFSKFLFL